MIEHYSTTITTDWDGYTHEVPLFLEYEYHPAMPGKRGEFGVPEEPDEPAHVEILTVKLHTQPVPPYQELVSLPPVLMSLEQCQALEAEILLHHQEEIS